MATVTGVHASRVLEIEATTIVDASVDEDGDLTFETRDGTQIPAGNVKGPQGQIGPPGGLLDFWPVHSVYISMAPTNPATLFGGTWQAIGQGRVLVGVDPSQEEFDEAGKTGGEKEHTLTTAEMPSHSHSINHKHGTFSTASGGSHKHTQMENVNNADGSHSRTVRSGAIAGANNVSSDGSHAHNIDIPTYTGSSGSVGSNDAHNNLQPYLAVFMWRRTA